MKANSKKTAINRIRRIRFIPVLFAFKVLFTDYLDVDRIANLTKTKTRSIDSVKHFTRGMEKCGNWQH